MKKKVLFYMYNLYGGGAERTVINLLNNINKEKIEPVLVLGSDNNNDYLDLLNSDIRIIQLNCLRARDCIFKLRKIFITENPDTIFSTLNFNNFSLILAKILSFRSIYTVVRVTNNNSHFEHVSKTKKIMSFVLYNYFSDKVIALSTGVKNDLIDNFRIKKDKIKVIYNPIDISNIKKMSNEVVDDFEKKEKEKLIIAVGRLVEVKDYDTLIKAFKEVFEKLPSSKLLILGKGPKEDELKRLCFSLNIEKGVIFLGFKKNPYKYMRLADVFVLCSKSEGFGHVITEAMATGTPVISTDCKSGPSEIIENNKYGVLVPVGNSSILAKKIYELLDSTSSKEKYENLGYERAEYFNAKKIAREYELTF